MKRCHTFPLAIAYALGSAAQFPPPAGQPGTTAIAQDSSVFVAWATGCTLVRGPQDVSSVEPVPVSIGDETSALGEAGANGVVSLGDGGTALLTFAQAITNGPGWDFAVFENSFSDTYLELAFVEVSSNGVDFVRFPATSNTQTDTQVGGFGSIDATEIDNLAGKYRGGYGTPFDLDDVVGHATLDVDHINHIRLVDVVGCIRPAYATYDQFDQVVNDPWTTPFPSSGFDLDAVGVMNQHPLAVDESVCLDTPVLFPNPATHVVHVRMTENTSPLTRIALMDATGRVVLEQTTSISGGVVPIGLGSVPVGAYAVRIIDQSGRVMQHSLIVHAY